MFLILTKLKLKYTASDSDSDSVNIFHKIRFKLTLLFIVDHMKLLPIDFLHHGHSVKREFPQSISENRESLPPPIKVFLRDPKNVVGSRCFLQMIFLITRKRKSSSRRKLSVFIFSNQKSLDAKIPTGWDAKWWEEKTGKLKYASSGINLFHSLLVLLIFPGKTYNWV